MRDIKFRAWHNTTLSGEYVMSQHDEVVKNCGAYICADDKYPNRIIMQFTGLTDKNGVEIYEGDIVEERRKNACWDSDKVFILKVSFYRGMFVAGKSNALHGFSGVTYKVIGNIHENPELLNK